MVQGPAGRRSWHPRALSPCVGVDGEVRTEDEERVRREHGAELIARAFRFAQDRKPETEREVGMEQIVQDVLTRLASNFAGERGALVMKRFHCALSAAEASLLAYLEQQIDALESVLMAEDLARLESLVGDTERLAERVQAAVAELPKEAP